MVKLVLWKVMICSTMEESPRRCYTGLGAVSNSATPAVNLVKVIFFRAGERNLYGAITDAIQKAEVDPWFHGIQLILHKDKGFVFLFGLCFGSGSKDRGMINRKFWFPRIAFLGYFAGTTHKLGKVSMGKLSLFSTKETDHQLATFLLAKLEVNFNGTQEICYSLPSIFYPVDQGILKDAELESVGDTWYSFATRFKWDPGGSFSSFYIRLFLLTYRLTASLLATVD